MKLSILITTGAVMLGVFSAASAQSTAPMLKATHAINSVPGHAMLPAKPMSQQKTPCTRTDCVGSIQLTMKPAVTSLPVQFKLSSWQSMKIRAGARAMASEITAIPNFNAIKCDGAIDLTLTPLTEQKNNAIHFNLNPMQSIQLSVHNHILTINEAHPAHGQSPLAHLTVPVKVLSSLQVLGHSSVHAAGLKTDHLILNTLTNGVVIIKGHVNVKQITAKGAGKINLQWINADKLEVNASGKSDVDLSGIAKNLRVTSSAHSRVDSQYLRVNNIWARSEDHAKVRVLPLDSLRVFARDDSDIYYYKEPKHITKNSRDSSNILLLETRN